MISIGIPAFKPDFLEDAIVSVLEQTYSDFELIIVDDNPQVRLDKIVSKFSDSRVRYYKNSTNLGLTSPVKNWNTCLQYAKGEYFILFSDDDVYHKDFLNELMFLTQKYPLVSIFHSRVVKIDEKNNIIGLTPTCPEYETSLDFIWHTLHGFRNLFAIEFLCKTDALRRAGGFFDLPLAWGSDYITWFNVSLNSGIVFCPKPLSYWRNSGTNISSVGNTGLRLKALDGYRNWLTSYFNTYKTENILEQKMIVQCQDMLNSFFTKKREYLLSQEIIKIGLFRSLLRSFSFVKQYNLSIAKVILNLIKGSF
jgi:glycosyltransferase involved in cell wall biosynthesis